MKLIAFTNPYEITFEADVINRLFREGLDELHIRKPQFTKVDTIQFIEKIDEEHRSKIILHSYYQLAPKFNLGGVHIDSEWRKSSLLNYILKKIILRNKQFKIVSSSHNYHIIEQKHFAVDEMIIGPVLCKTSETNSNPTMRIDGLEKALKHKKQRVAGMGGVTAQKMDFFEVLGFDAVVIQSAIWKSSDPVRAFIQIRDYKLEQYRAIKLSVV